MAMEQAERVGPDRLRVPMTAQGEGGLIGDAMVEIGPQHPLYQQWADWLDHQAAAAGSGPARSGPSAR